VKRGLVKELMSKKMTMKLSIQKRFCLGHGAFYQVLELTPKTMKQIQIEIL
jgi:hypothetical protein